MRQRVKNKQKGREEETQKQDFSLLKESNLLQQRRRKHGTTIPPSATFIIIPSIKHGCQITLEEKRRERISGWRRGKEGEGQEDGARRWKDEQGAFSSSLEPGIEMFKLAQ